MAHREEDDIAGSRKPGPIAQADEVIGVEPLMGVSRRRRRYDDVYSAKDRVSLLQMRPAVGAVAAMARGWDTLVRTPKSVAQPQAENSGAPSIAPTILAFATGGTATCSGRRSCAKLYLALQGKAIPIRDTTAGMDPTRLQWWAQAMDEYATNRWGGTAQGTSAIAAAQPLIWEQAQAATKAWEMMKQEQDVRPSGL